MIDWNLALKYAQLVKLAESVRPEGSYGQDVIDKIEALGYTFLNAIYGDDLATDLDPKLGMEVTFGFVAVSKDLECVVAIRGTDNIWEWIEDGKFLMVPWRLGNTEDGFTGVYKSLRLKLSQPTAANVYVKDYVKSLFDTEQVNRLTVCGHSLGGALATLSVIDVCIDCHCLCNCYTFASPRTGDHIFSGEYNAYLKLNTFRVENRFDLVPKLPPILPLPYEHVAEKYELKGKFSFNPAQEHHLTTYIDLITQMVKNVNA